MNKRQIHWKWALPSLLTLIFTLLALIFRAARASQGDSTPDALLEVGLPLVIGLGVVTIPVVLYIKIDKSRNDNSMKELQSHYSRVFYTFDFRYGSRFLTINEKEVAIWRKHKKELEREVSWQQGRIPIEKAEVPVSRLVTAPGIAFTDPDGKLRRMVVCEKVTTQVHPLEYSDFLQYL